MTTPLFIPTDRSVLVTPPAAEPLTLEQVKLRAGQDWATGDPRDQLVADYLAAARQRVEQDTGLALLAQTRDAYAQNPYTRCGYGSVGVQLGSMCLPLQSVASVSTVDPDGTLTALDPAGYAVDKARGRIVLSAPVASGFGLVVRVTAGWLTPVALAAEAPGLVQAVGLLTTHYFTVGRDLVAVGHIVAETPYGYDEALAAFRAVSLL